MTLIKCRCGKQEKSFQTLTHKDLPNGWDCDDLCGPRDEKQPEVEEQKQPELKLEEAPKEEQPKEEKRSKRNRKNKQEQ